MPRKNITKTDVQPLPPLQGPGVPRLLIVPVVDIRSSRQNPRRDAGGEDLAGLQASLGAGDTPLLVQYPVVERTGDSQSRPYYRLIVGERRVTAARAAGHLALPCLVHDTPIDPVIAHSLRVIENLHRAPVHPLDEALALKVAYLLANAEAVGLSDKARRVMGADKPLLETLADLTRLTDSKWQPADPPVTWRQALDRLGIAREKGARIHLMRLLRVEADLHGDIRQLNLTAAATRAVGTLAPEHQRLLIGTLNEHPALVAQVTGLCNEARKHTYSKDLREALDVALGKTQKPTVAGKPKYGFSAAPKPLAEPVKPRPADGVEDAVSQLTAAVSALTRSLKRARELGGGDVAGLPAPWNEDALAAVQLARKACAP
jgi:ParB/RepB/Spo0J family partition protein